MPALKSSNRPGHTEQLSHKRAEPLSNIQRHLPANPLAPLDWRDGGEPPLPARALDAAGGGRSFLLAGISCRWWVAVCAPRWGFSSCMLG